MAVPKKVRFEVFKRDKFTCQYCGRKAPDVVLECEHIEPRAEGGSDDIINLVTSCQGCNRGKGPVPLDDDAAVEKARHQLEELQERREQLEMMVAWKRGLVDLEDTAVNEATAFWEELSGYGLTEVGKKTVRKLITRYGMGETLESMRIAASTYLRYDGGDVRSKSVEHALDKLGGICYNREKWRKDPLQKAVDLGRYHFVRAYRRECSPHPPDWALYDFWSSYGDPHLREHPTNNPEGAACDLADWLAESCKALYYAGDHGSYRSALEILGDMIDSQGITGLQEAS